MLQKQWTVIIVNDVMTDIVMLLRLLRPDGCVGLLTGSGWDGIGLPVTSDGRWTHDKAS